MKILLGLMLSLLFLLGCSSQMNQISVIKIKGSDTMLELTEKLAEVYMKENPGVSIYVYGGGTALGVKALINGEADITTASRNLRPEESKDLADYYGTLTMIFLVAKDALSIYLNPANPVKNISKEDLRNIYECKITNWKDIGGLDEKIIPVIRNPNSGTHLYFKDHILEGESYCKNSVVQPTTRDVINFIMKSKNAVGYGGVGYRGEVKSALINGIEPSEKSARNDTYPITRYLHFFTAKVPTGAVKDFIDWVLSPEGQQIVDQSGFISLWELPQ